MKENKKEEQEISKTLKNSEENEEWLVNAVTGPPKLSPKIITVLYNKNRKD